MSTVDPVAAAATEIGIEIAAPPKYTIRYRKEWGHSVHHHVSVDFSAITPGDIGGLYAALSEAITADLVRREGSSKSGKGLSRAVPRTMLPLDCDIKVELCRLLDDQGRLYIPPVKETSVFRQKYAQLQGGNATDKTYELLAFLLDRDVKKAWEHLQDGLFFEEEEGWPWYSLLVSYSHESRLDKVVKHQGRLVMADIDPQTFFPLLVSPPPTPPSASSYGHSGHSGHSGRAGHARHNSHSYGHDGHDGHDGHTSYPDHPVLMHGQTLPLGGEIIVEKASKPRRTKTLTETTSSSSATVKPHRSEKPSRSSSYKLASAKYADVKAKSRSAFSIGSLVKADR
ncbi:uncharacterized protein H6S33_012460 [Morchella sextelata]|uniref:uncharacterized protein n=1 Tax=Morchella sextelata TaxID=1174677 RepID=UPI001D03CB79|nr:uncharacterized protein H6S33_012460 [Morchella sextelata]KAH0609914.1 hypothetical protein H6S33_012460 [Morchella sextelata]